VIKKIDLVDKLQLELIEVKKENIKLQAEYLQRKLIKLQEDHITLDNKYKSMIELINSKVGVNISKYKVNESCEIVGNDSKVIEFEEEKPKE
jgi:hypothetical protein